MWRKPISEQEGYWKSKLALFASKEFSGGLLRLNPANFKYINFGKVQLRKSIEKLKFDQQFIERRLYILGSDLAAAHFVVFRGGAVKFANQSEWIRDDEKKNNEYDDNLPNSFNPDYILEAIDFSGTNIIYEGLINIENLQELKWLSFAFCPYINNWVIDKISGQHGDTLEYLDISYTNISAHALGALYRFKKLKTLKLYGFSEDSEFIVACNKIKQDFPYLVIMGIPEELTEQLKDNAEC